MHMGVVSILAEEQRIAAALTEAGQTFGEAVTSRCAHVAAAERFYVDLMVYQWRLDAIDVQINATATAGKGVFCLESRRRENALQQSLEQISAQRASALQSVEERAATYGLTVSSRGNALDVSGISDRIAISNHEKQSALERYQRHVQETFDEITSEAQEIVKVAPGEEGLRGLSLTLDRRRTFWNKQLEETWDSWYRATGGMHQSGDSTVEAWTSIISLSAQARQCLRQTAARLPILARALGAAAARGIEAEFMCPLGLSGLNGPRNIEASKFNVVRRSAADSTQEWVVSRVDHLVSIFKLLQDAESLHEVGEQLLQSKSLVCSAGRPLLSDQMIAAVSAIATANDLESAREAAAFATLATGGHASPTDRLVPWFAVALVEGLCDVAWQGDVTRVVKMMDVCERLGGANLLHALSLARSQAPPHGMRTAIELAMAGGNSKALVLLQAGQSSSEVLLPASKCQATPRPKSHAEALIQAFQRSFLGNY